MLQSSPHCPEGYIGHLSRPFVLMHLFHEVSGKKTGVHYQASLIIIIILNYTLVSVLFDIAISCLYTSLQVLVVHNCIYVLVNRNLQQ